MARSRTTRVKMNEVKKVMERQIKALTAENGKSGKEKRKIEDQSEKQDR